MGGSGATGLRLAGRGDSSRGTLLAAAPGFVQDCGRRRIPGSVGEGSSGKATLPRSV